VISKRIGLLKFHSNVSKNGAQELQQFLERLESLLTMRGHMLDATVKCAGIYLRVRLKLDYESALMLPSLHHGRRIGVPSPMSHKGVVMLWSYLGNGSK
jgi:hypothetical protein